jgi:D-xylose transport system ATP-binding protein
MVGREMKERFPEGNRKPGDVLLKVEDLHATYPNDTSREVLKGISFDLRKGEILGIAGLMGSGRTELAMTIFGEFGRITQGNIVLDGKNIKIKNARDAIKNRISLVPEDRKGMGLVLINSILKNISLPNLGQFSSFMRIDRNAEIKVSTEQAENLAIKTPNLQLMVDSLSGGNQQKVVIGKWLMSNPQILIMDDPTRGVDVGAKFEIYKLMNQLTEEGVSIIMISSDLEEVLGMSDRILVMCQGASRGVLDIKEATQEKVMALATGIA